MTRWECAVALTLGVGCAAPAPEPTRTPNVLLVSLDTLRADRVGAFGAEVSRMPNLDRFASESIVYERAYSQSNETPFSHASLLTGRYPTELGRLDYDFRLPADIPSIQSVLRAYGYHTGAFVAGAFLSASFGFDAGFDTFASPRDWGSLWHTGPLALSWIDTQRDTPWFAFVHAYDMHAPYSKPAPFGGLYEDQSYDGPALSALAEAAGTDRIVDGGWYTSPRGSSVLDMWTNRIRTVDEGGTHHRLSAEARQVEPFTEADASEVRAAYDGAATWVDSLFGLFVADLAARGHLEDTVIVVLSDHGEELGERGVFNHRWGLSEEVLHVPLLVRLPRGVGGGQRVSSTVELTDVLPTVLGLVGAAPPAGISGRALVGLAGVLATEGPRTAFAEGTCRAVAARFPDVLTVFSGLSPDSPYLADAIAKAPGTTPWFSGGDPVRAREALAAWRARLSPPQGPSAPAADTLKSNLREHGYWEAQ